MPYNNQSQPGGYREDRQARDGRHGRGRDRNYAGYPDEEETFQPARTYSTEPRYGREDFETDDLGYGDRGYDEGVRVGGQREGERGGGRRFRSRNGDYGYYGRGHRGEERGPYGERDEERGFFDRAGDEVASWFGDEGAARRREEDRFRGKGPRGYKRSDQRIEEDVNDRLSDDPGLDATDITVSVKDGEVTLNGKVTSRWDRRRAEDAVETISGVRYVQNNLRLREQGGDESRQIPLS